MGADCSNCKCTNGEDEKILVIPDVDKISSKDNRKYKLHNDKLSSIKSSTVNKAKNSLSRELLNNILDYNPGLEKKLIKIQGLFKMYRDRKIYLSVLNKIRESQIYFTSEEAFETLKSYKDTENTENIFYNPNTKLHKATYTYKSNAVYSGEWKGGFRHGYGKMLWPDNTYYEGMWNLGVAEGEGMIVYSNGNYSRGEFKHNKLNGRGEYHNNETIYKYIGIWVNDFQNGQGTESWPDGSEYLGLFENGNKEKFGKYCWVDGSYYIGEWKDNKINGYGIYYWNDGRKYIGEWKESKMNGYGIFFWKDGKVFKGNYKDDKKHDFGVYIKPDGKKYEGYWNNGLQSNLGRFTKKDGSFKIGIWRDNQLAEVYSSESEYYLMKSKEINNLVDANNEKIDSAIDNLRSVFNIYLPNSNIEDLLE